MNTMYKENLKSALNKFFNGRIYPIVIAALVLLSHIFGIEFYLNFINIALCVVSFAVTDSVKPFIPTLCTYIYQLSRKTNLLYPQKEGFLLQGATLYTLVFLLAIVFAFALLLFIRRCKKYPGILKKLPLLPSAILLSVAFLMNGAFSPSWTVPSLLYGVSQIVTFFVIFYFFFVGLRGEKLDEVVDYFAYVTAIMAVILILQTGYLYASVEDLFAGSAVIKFKIDYAWGNSNTAGQQMVMTLPMLFFGVMKGKRPFVYYTIAVLIVICCGVTLSRNALLLSVLGFVLLSVISCFTGGAKKQMRVVFPIIVLCIMGGVVLLWGEISQVFTRYFELGFSDAGRYDLWKRGFEAFLEAPVFGKGFFGVFPGETQRNQIFPILVHNTPIELLCASGLFGLLAYLVYRINSFKHFVRRPSLAKTLLGLSILTVVLSSLLDNFIFYNHQMLYYPVVHAIACSLYFEEEELLPGDLSANKTLK